MAIEFKTVTAPSQQSNIVTTPVQKVIPTGITKTMAAPRKNIPRRDDADMEITNLDPEGVGSSTYPRSIEVKSPKADAGRALVQWTGDPPGLQVGDFLRCRRDSRGFLVIEGYDGNTTASAAGVWPEPGKAKIGITEYATIAAAIAAASSGDTILVGVGTYTCDDQTIPNGVTLQGTNKFDSILRTTSGNYVLLSPTSGSCWVLDCTVDNQNTSGTTLGAFAANNPSTVVLENCILQSTASGGTNRRGLDSYTSTITARNCEFYASGGTTNVAVHTLNASATTITLKDCYIDGATYDIYHQTAFGAADLEDTELINNTLGTLGTYQGWYYYNNLAYLLASDGTIYTPLATKTNSSDILRYDSLSSLDFVATINGTPSGTSVVYNAPSSGDEENLNVFNSSQLCKMLLHNTTRGDSALISDVNTGTNTITLTTTAPGAWANGDTITIRSQVNTGTPLGGAIYFCDLEWVGATHQGFVGYQNLRDTGSVGVVGIHPYATYNASKLQVFRTQGTGQIFESSYLVGLDAANKRFCLTWQASGSNTLRLILRQSGEN